MIFLFKCSKSKVPFIVVVVTLFSLMFSLVTVASAAPKRIGVTKFETNNLTVRVQGGGYYDIGLGASDILATELSKNKNFEVIEREQIRSVLQEQAFGLSGAVDDSTAAQMGKLLGLKYLIYGKIISAGAETKNTQLGPLTINELNVKVQIAVRMIDATTGAIVWADQVGANTKKTGGAYKDISTETGVSASVYDEILNKAIGKIVKAINQQAPTEGAIVKASGKKVYLDIGMDQGVRTGQSYAVYREGESIMNAAGQIIGVEKTDLGRVKITSVEGQMSIAEVEGKGLVGIQPGDKVRSL